VEAHQQMANGRKETQKMSYILDALKKLENEKQKKSRGNGMVSISGELFRDEPRRSHGNNTWKIVVAIVLAVSLATFGATWFYLKPAKVHKKLGSRPVVSAPPTPVAKTTIPVTSAPVAPAPGATAPGATAPGATAPGAAPQPVAVPQPSQAQKPPAATAVSPAHSDSTPPVASRKRGKRMKERNAALVRSEPEAKSAAISVAAPADIKVSGIAWQDERRYRRAVINGFLMHEGSMVSGARVTEILQDRVRFSSDGKVFEVPLALSGFPGAGKQ
jgi:general secretion pathway protein B